MTYLPSSYDPWLVLSSVLLAAFASFVALDLASRVRCADPLVAERWLIGGSMAMGAGVWAMHFLGMHAFRLPIWIAYGGPLTVVSLVAAWVTSAIGLWIAGRNVLDAKRWIIGSLTMGAGICAMHYTGMAAIDLAPGIVWNWWLVAASAVVAVAASAAALFIFFWLPTVHADRRFVRQCAAAAVMGIAISGMHYIGMAAANFPFGAVCTTVGGLDNEHIIGFVAFAAVMLMASALITSLVDAHMRRRTDHLSDSLAHARVRLESVDHELAQRALLDPLTGLPNRLVFEDRLAHALVRSERSRKSVRGPEEKLAVLFIDIDGLRTVNESLGHTAGDDVIRHVARQIRDEARESDTVTRVGGDQFLVLLEGMSSTSDSVALAMRVVAATGLPFQIGKRRVQVSVSIGIVVHPDHGEPTRLLAQADAAMRAAKRAGRGTYVLFESHMHDDMTDQLDLINDLRQAIDLGQLELHYQPKVDGRRQVICGVEALLRWNHPTRGWISPVVFIPLAERFGLIIGLGNWVIEEACRQLNAWATAGLHMRTAINLSVHQLREGGLVAHLQSAMERHGITASQLLCEITESVAMQDFEAIQRTLDGLGAIGVYLSIDDFGTGYSSLSYLRQLPARQLKIDRSFINDLEGSSDARAVVDAVVRLAHALGLRVVAEGVETVDQRDILQKLGCDELQGYFFARPMPAPDLLAWMSGQKAEGSPDFADSMVHEMVGMA